MKCFTFCLSVGVFVDPPKDKTLASRAFQNLIGELFVGNLERSTVIVTEIKLRQIALQVSFRNVAVNTDIAFAALTLARWIPDRRAAFCSAGPE